MVIVLNPAGCPNPSRGTSPDPDELPRGFDALEHVRIWPVGRDGGRYT
jgi:hypothetical protein